MPSAGLSLLGFMEQQQALNHLKSACIPRDTSDAALIAEWQSARARRGTPLSNAGKPRIEPIPKSYNDYVQQLIDEPWAAPAFAGPLRGASFALVEIDPLIAFQFTIDSDRAAHHCRQLGHPPTPGELLPICLPRSAAIEDYTAFPGPSSMMIKARSLNLRIAAHGLFDESFVGIQFSVSLPFASVVGYKDRFYLHNGYNRAYGVRKTGATHMPCMIREVSDLTSAGLRADGTTFSPTLLQADDVPTLAHFTQGRAYEVTLRAMSRIIQVSWAEYAVPDE
jgi:hypothetical protein